jgi:hypothetical protein
LHRVFSIFQILLAGQQSEQTNKLQNSALNMFLMVVNEPEEQEFFLKN